MSRSDRLELLKIAAEGVLTVILISICGWVLLTYPEPTPAPYLQADKGEIIRLTAPAMAEQTARINNEMARRSRQ